MADTYTYLTQTGVIVADTSEILTAVQNEFITALGADLDVDPETPQGVLIAAETLARDSVVRNNAALANQINPNIAGGVFLDAICALTALQRDAATYSVVSGVTVTGVAGTVIPAGSRAKTAAGDEFQTVSSVTVPAGGTGTANFQAVELGAVPCTAGALTQIVTDVLGWETVTNPTAATIGVDEQSDVSLRGVRRNTLAKQGSAVAGAITSALYATDGVTSLQFRENIESTTEVIDGITMVPHSVYACVAGGTDALVAAALLDNKSSGSAWNGAQEIPVVDAYSGQTYTVKFDRPTDVPILCRVTVKAGTGLSNPTEIVTDAILAWETLADDGLPGLRVGGDVSPFEISGAINSASPSLYVQKVELSLVSPLSYSVAEIVVATDALASLTESSISVVLA